MAALSSRAHSANRALVFLNHRIEQDHRFIKRLTHPEQLRGHEYDPSRANSVTGLLERSFENEKLISLAS
jgi:transposase-like protein